MSPSLFNNEYSRGPLYRYWKDRGDEEKSLREQRVQEAKLRSKGIQPISPTFGPSSNDQYASRATSGPPVYVYPPDNDNANHNHNIQSTRTHTTDGGPGRSPFDLDAARNPDADPEPQAHPHPHPEPLPSYDTTIGAAAAGVTGPLAQHQQQPQQYLLAEEEKARLRQLEDQRRQVADDAAIAQTLSNQDVDVEARSTAVTDESVPVFDNYATSKGKGKGKEKDHEQTRRRSTVGKIGSWLADAATGYTKKQDRW